MISNLQYVKGNIDTKSVFPLNIILFKDKIIVLVIFVFYFSELFLYIFQSNGKD